MACEDDMFATAASPPDTKKTSLYNALTAASRPVAANQQPNKRATEADASQQGASKKPREAYIAGSSSNENCNAEQPTGRAITAAYSEDKGSRKEMEDIAVICLDDGDHHPSGHRVSFFGVFDGHGGRQVAQHAAQHLHSTVMAAGLSAEAQSTASVVNVKASRAAITAGFKQLDEAILKRASAEGWCDGATAVTVWVVDQTALVANVGDAKCVLARRPQDTAAGEKATAAATGSSCQASHSTGCVPQPQAANDATSGIASDTADHGGSKPSSSQQQGQQPNSVTPAVQPGSTTVVQQTAQPEQYKAITLTREHRAFYPQERQRIERAGGFVSTDGRLGGRIEVSRAFGDRAFKKQGMSAVPDIQAFQIGPRDAFMLCGCDGFWGVFSAQDAVDFAAKELAKGYDVKQTCNRLIYASIRERHCKDNCTVMMIKVDGQRVRG